MISDWKGDRRIGVPSFREIIAAELRPLAILLGGAAATGLFILLVRVLFGGPATLMSGSRIWTAAFAIVGGALTFQAVLSRRWVLALLAGFLVVAVAVAVALFGQPAFTATMCALTPCIIPDPL